MSLAVQMAVATALGILTGFFFGDLCSFFAPYGSAYIMLLKATAIPYLIVAIIHGVAQLTPFQAKLIIKKGIMFIGIAWSINIAMIYLVYGTFPKAESTQSGYISTETSSINFAELLIPENIFYDLANNIVPAIVIFSINREGELVPRSNFKSLAGIICINIVFKFPAMVISLTG